MSIVRSGLGFIALDIGIELESRCGSILCDSRRRPPQALLSQTYLQRLRAFIHVVEFVGEAIQELSSTSPSMSFRHFSNGIEVVRARNPPGLPTDFVQQHPS